MIDIKRLEKASENICVSGICNGKMREEKIEEAIKLIQDEPTKFLKTDYLGVKNYAGFGDQSADCGYGMCPRHGSIVFEIGRTDRGKRNITLGEDEIYYLMVARDNPQGFGEYEDNHTHGYRPVRDIKEFIWFIKKNRKEKEEIDLLIQNLKIDNGEAI